MVLDPYQTSYGSLLKIDKIEKMVTEYLISTTSINLNYEYAETMNVGLVFITGFDLAEQNIPAFDHPLVINKSNRTIVVTDVRKYISKVEKQPISLQEVARDMGNLKFCILRSIATADLLNEEYSKYKTYSRAIGSGFGFFIGHVVDSMVRLNPLEKVNVEITAAYYMLHSLFDSKEFDNPEKYNYIRSSIKAILSRCKYSIPMQMAAIEAVVDKLADLKYGGNIDTLLSYIVEQLDNGKDKVINKQVLINAVSNMWFGHGGSETILISLEHLPTWVSLLYTVEANTMFKKTRLATILSKHATQIGLKDYVGLVEKDLKAKEI